MIKLSTENFGSIFSFYVFDKSNQNHLKLPFLSLKNEKNSKFYNKKQNTGIEEKHEKLQGFSSLTCLDLIESLKLYSNTFISNNDYKFLDELDTRYKELNFNLLKKCDCENILIIDDDFFNIFTIELLLSENPHKSVKAINGKTVISFMKDRYMKENCPHCRGYQLIVMSCELLKKDCIEIVKELNKMMKNHEIPVINIIGVMEKKIEKEYILCMEAGMKDILIKPISKKRLNKMIKQWIRNN